MPNDPMVTLPPLLEGAGLIASYSKAMDDVCDPLDLILVPGLSTHSLDHLLIARPCLPYGYRMKE